LLELKDPFGNSIPLDDHGAFHDKFAFEFALGSEFANTDCTQYGAIAALQQNKIRCKLRPSKAGI